MLKLTKKRRSVGKELEKFLQTKRLDLNSMIARFPEFYTILLTGPPGVGKSEYCFKIVHYYSQLENDIIYITVDDSSADIKRRLSDLGLEYDRIIFVDCYSGDKRLKQNVDTRNLYINNLSNIENLSLQINTAIKMVKLPVKIIFDSLSPLLLYNPLPTMEKFLHRLCSRIKTEYGFVVFTIHNTMHDKKLITTLMSFVDGVIELKFDKNLERCIRVLYLKGLNITSNWLKFDHIVGLRKS